MLLVRAVICSLLAHILVLVVPLAERRDLQYHLPRPLIVSLPSSGPAQAVPLDRVEVAPVNSGPAHSSEIAELTPVPVTVRERDVPRKQLGASIFLPASALSKKPSLLNPEWLDEAWGLPVQAHGDVQLRVSIDRQGRVIKVESDSGSSEFFDWIREQLPKKARFSPGEKAGVPVDSILVIRLRLEPLVN